MAELDLSPDLRTAVLELGLEDRIPVPEATQVADERVGEGKAVEQVRAVLEALVQEGHIRMYRGHWRRDDPHEITVDEALTLLRDARWFRFRTDDPWEERLYFVNVENLSAG